MNALSDGELRLMDAYWRAANYLSVGQIYLLDNPLLREPLQPEHVKPRLLGHWGTTPGPELRLRPPQPRHPRTAISTRSSSSARATAARPRSPTPTSRGPTARSTPTSRTTRQGMQRLFRQFSFPGGIPSHVAPETPGSIHEGGELGYALSHAYGAAFDNPDLLVCCVVGDGEAETGPLATSWHSNKFLEPGARRRGAADPAPERLQDRQPDGAGAHPRRRADVSCSRATATAVHLRRGARAGGDAPARWPRRSSARSRRFAASSGGTRRGDGRTERPRWPMIVLRIAEGLDGPEDRSTACRSRARCARTRCRSPSVRTNPEHLAQLEAWMRSYRPEELFDEQRRAACRSWRRWRRRATRRMSANPHANGGAAAARPARCPTSATTPSTCRAPGRRSAEATRVLGGFLRDVMERNADELPRRSAPTRPRRTGWARVFEVTDRAWDAEILADDDHLAPDGRVMEMLTRAPVPGLARGLPAHRTARLLLLLRGVHPHRRLDVQPARQVAEGDARHPVAPADRVAQLPAHARTSGGRTTTASRTRIPGFIDHVVNKKAEVIRVYLPPDANTLLVGHRPLPAQPQLRQRDRRRQAAGAAVADDGARRSRTAPRGIGIWEWASNDDGERARRRDGLLRRRADARDARAPSISARATAGAQGARRQRRRPDAPAARERASARPLRPRVRRALHRRQAGHLRLSTAIRG